MKMPKAQQLPSGSWRIQITVDGKRIGITEPTELDGLKRLQAYSKARRNIPKTQCLLRWKKPTSVISKARTVYSLHQPWPNTSGCKRTTFKN